jgi:hypothetical protein
LEREELDEIKKEIDLELPSKIKMNLKFRLLGSFLSLKIVAVTVCYVFLNTFVTHLQ